VLLLYSRNKTTRRKHPRRALCTGSLFASGPLPPPASELQSPIGRTPSLAPPLPSPASELQSPIGRTPSLAPPLPSPASTQPSPIGACSAVSGSSASP